MLMRTEGIVLRSMPFRETTRIVTVFTKERGKLTLVARGGQRAKNPFGGTLQPLSHVHALIYTRATRSMQILSDCSHVKIYLKIAKDLKKLAVGQRICEFIQSLTEEGQDAPDIYDLLVNVLEALNDPSSNHIIVQLYFQLQLMDCLGFAPAFTKESVEEVHDSGGYLSLEDGTISGTSIDHLPAVHASRSVLRAFSILYRTDLSIVLRLQLTDMQQRELYDLITQFMRYHVGDAYPEKGAKVIHQLLKVKQ